MDDLISQYEAGRTELRLEIKIRKIKRRELNEAHPDRIRLNHEISIMEGMVRDMTEAIRLMGITYGDLRAYGNDRHVLMDPSDMQRLHILAASYEPDIALDDLESILRREIMQRYGSMVRSRMSKLTIKQRTTLQRWIHEDDPRTMAEIAREDGVSRQAVWVRIFGDKTNRGALRTLRGDEQHGDEAI